MFGNRVLRRIFGPKWDEVAGEWRKLHNEELKDLHSSHNAIRVIKLRIMRWAGHVAHVWAKRSVHRVLVEKPERKRRLGRPKHRRKVNITMGLQEVEWEGMGWFYLTQDGDRWRAVVNVVMNVRVP